MWHPRPVTVLHKSHIYWQWGSCQSDTQGQFTAPETYWHPPLCVCVCVCRCACVKLGCDFESQFDRERWRCNHSLDVSWREKWDQGRNGSKDIFRIKLFSFLYKTKRKKKQIWVWRCFSNFHTQGFDIAIHFWLLLSIEKQLLTLYAVFRHQNMLLLWCLPTTSSHLNASLPKEVYNILLLINIQFYTQLLQFLGVVLRLFSSIPFLFIRLF